MEEKYITEIPARIIYQLAKFSEDNIGASDFETWDILNAVMLGITWSEKTHDIAKAAAFKIMEELEKHNIHG